VLLARPGAIFCQPDEPEDGRRFISPPSGDFGFELFYLLTEMLAGNLFSPTYSISVNR
jgi:hypothetical protein